MPDLLTYYVLRLTQPPTLSGTEAHGLRGEGLVWLIGAVLHCGSICSLSRAMDGRKMRRGIVSSSQSAASSEIVKRC